MTHAVTTESTLKHVPDDENEVHDVLGFVDEGNCQVTAVAQFPPEVAQVVVDRLAGIVRAAHRSPEATSRNEHGIMRAQTFEEGTVYMLASPYDGYFADRYLMDFYDVNERDICSRMHFHTGLRFVRMMTGVDTWIRTSSLSPLRVTYRRGCHRRAAGGLCRRPARRPRGGTSALRYNVVVPPRTGGSTCRSRAGRRTSSMRSAPMPSSTRCIPRSRSRHSASR